MTSILLPNTRYFIPYLEAHSWKMNLNFGKNFNPTENHPRPIIQTFRLTQKSYNRRKDVLKICSKFTREHQSMSKLLCNFIEIALRHGCSPVNVLHIFRTPVHKNTSRWLLLIFGIFDWIIDRIIKLFPRLIGILPTWRLLHPNRISYAHHTQPSTT